jgi:DNA-binding response OmpR family regulator
VRCPSILSKPERGTPQSPYSSRTVAAHTGAGRQKEAGAVSGGTILLIEDEIEIADLLRIYFEREGFRVAHAKDGEAGLQRLGAGDARIVLLDIGLPGMDGLEVCRRIRSSSDVPVIMLTARDAEVDKVVGLEIGADDYVTKPFSPRELVARVKAVLRRGEEGVASPRVVHIGGFAIDSGRRSVTTPEGVDVQPTARELAHRGVRVSRSW